MSVAPSTCYAAKTRPPSARNRRDQALTPALREICEAARRAGHNVGRDRVARLMRATSVEAAMRNKRVMTTRPATGLARHPDLVQA
jgi:putative transposase